MRAPASNRATDRRTALVMVPVSMRARVRTQTGRRCRARPSASRTSRRAAPDEGPDRRPLAPERSRALRTYLAVDGRLGAQLGREDARHLRREALGLGRDLGGWPARTCEPKEVEPDLGQPYVAGGREL